MELYTRYVQDEGTVLERWGEKRTEVKIKYRSRVISEPSPGLACHPSGNINADIVGFV